MRRNVIFFVGILLIVLSGCQKQNAPKEIFQYKGSYVGDNSAVGNITSQLPLPAGEQLSGMELQTKTEPYGIILNYQEATASSVDYSANYHSTALFNATYILTLIKNADWVTFHFLEEDLTVTRDALEEWYGQDVRAFTSEQELTKAALATMENESKVEEFFY